MSDTAGEQTFPSTTYAWRKVKMKPPPAGHQTVRAKRGRWHGLPTWPRHRQLRIEVTYRGGAESWWLVKARGRHGVFPGCLALDDVMAQVLNEWDGPVIEGGAKASQRASRRGVML
jgi:hypothetical protein